MTPVWNLWVTVMASKFGEYMFMYGVPYCGEVVLSLFPSCFEEVVFTAFPMSLRSKFP